MKFHRFIKRKLIYVIPMRMQNRIGQVHMQYQDDKAEANYINAKTDATKRIRNEAIYKDISLQRKKDVE